MAEECKNMIGFKPSSTPITKLVIIYCTITEHKYVHMYVYPLLKSFLIFNSATPEAWPFLKRLVLRYLNMHWRWFVLHIMYLTSVIQYLAVMDEI